jgi:hypothetical protein
MEGMKIMEDIKKDDNEVDLQDIDVDFYNHLIDGLVKIYESINKKDN